MQANISFNSNPKQSIIKQLNKDMLVAITQTVHDVTFRRGVCKHLPPHIQACFFGSSRVASAASDKDNTLSNTTADYNLDKIFEEWNNKCNSAPIPSVVETLSPSELTDNTRSVTKIEPILPLIVPSKGGIFSSVKGMFFKKKSSSFTNSIKRDKETPKIGNKLHHVANGILQTYSCSNIL
jgi:hypothetical protein